MIGYVVPDSPAAKAGLKDGDKIVQIDNTVDPTWEDIIVKEAGQRPARAYVWVERGWPTPALYVSPHA